MPGMDGLEVARRLRAEHLPVRPLVLMLSSDDLKPQLSRLKQLGLSSYLVKPVTRRELFEAIRQVLQQANHQTANALPARHPAASEDEAPAMGAPIRILVAEDSPDNRMVVKAYLRRAPYELEFAENGRRAVELFQANRYALVLMDMQMPELDGFAATAKIRQWERSQALAPTPIVALTASVLEEDADRTEVRLRRESRGCL